MRPIRYGVIVLLAVMFNAGCTIETNLYQSAAIHCLYAGCPRTDGTLDIDIPLAACSVRDTIRVELYGAPPPQMQVTVKQVWPTTVTIFDQSFSYPYPIPSIGLPGGAEYEISTTFQPWVPFSSWTTHFVCGQYEAITVQGLDTATANRGGIHVIHRFSS